MTVIRHLSNNKDENSPSSLRSAMSQVSAVMIKNVLLLVYGMVTGFPTILIARLEENLPEDNIIVTEEEISWIGSIELMCVPFGCLASGFIVTIIGRKKAMQFVCLPFILSSLAFYLLINSIWQIYLALGILGLSAGFLEAPVITYVAEVTEPRLRGMLSGTANLACYIGTFIEFMLGTFLPWRTLAIINACIPVVSFLLLFIIPESPQWLITNKRYDEAKRGLAWLRGWTTVEHVEKEFEMWMAAENNKALVNQQQKNALAEYCRRDFIHPLILLFALFLIQSFCGSWTIQIYSVEIFRALHSPLDNYYATIIYSVVVFLGCLPCIMFIHLTGKRMLLFLTLVLSGISLAIVASYAHVAGYKYIYNAEGENTIIKDAALNNIPLIFVFIAAFGLNSGIIMVPWILIGEVFSYRTSHIGSGIAAAAFYVFESIASKVFLDSVASMTLPGVFWFFAGVCVLGLLIVYFCLPETEGKTLLAITNHFAGNSKIDNRVASKQNFNE